MDRVPRTADAINDKVAHFGGVRMACLVAAEDIAIRARASLARHRKTGEHRIHLETHLVDTHVVLTGTAALALETGHWYGSKYVEGIHVLKHASRDAKKG